MKLLHALSHPLALHLVPALSAGNVYNLEDSETVTLDLLGFPGSRIAGGTGSISLFPCRPFFISS